MNLKEFTLIWYDDSRYAEIVNNHLADNVNNTPKLKELRDWVEQNIFGFGERSFYWMWKLIIDEMSPDFKFLEIGVFRGQILALITMLGGENVYGITPLDSSDGVWESDYRKDIETLFNKFSLKLPNIIEGDSMDKKVIKEASKNEYDILYIDGGHTEEVIKSDLDNYLSFLKIGGYLVIDDCACKFKMPFGYFQGIEPVCKVVDELLPPFH